MFPEEYHEFVSGLVDEAVWCHPDNPNASVNEVYHSLQESPHYPEIVERLVLNAVRRLLREAKSASYQKRGAVVSNSSDDRPNRFVADEDEIEASIRRMRQKLTEASLLCDGEQAADPEEVADDMADNDERTDEYGVPESTYLAYKAEGLSREQVRLRLAERSGYDATCLGMKVVAADGTVLYEGKPRD